MALGCSPTRRLTCCTCCTCCAAAAAGKAASGPRPAATAAMARDDRVADLPTPAFIRACDPTREQHVDLLSRRPPRSMCAWPQDCAVAAPIWSLLTDSLIRPWRMLRLTRPSPGVSGKTCALCRKSETQRRVRDTIVARDYSRIRRMGTCHVCSGRKAVIGGGRDFVIFVFSLTSGGQYISTVAKIARCGIAHGKYWSQVDGFELAVTYVCHPPRSASVPTFLWRDSFRVASHEKR
jgi:hypothetical protein